MSDPEKPKPTTIAMALDAGLEAERMEPEGIVLKMPLGPNLSHVGTMYAGSMFTLAEIMGGVAFRTYMKHKEVFPIVKGLNIKFVKPARTDVRAEYSMDQADADRILAECLEKGKANYSISLELKDENGVVVAVSEGFYQIRKGKTL